MLSKLLQVSVAYFPSKELWRLPGTMRYVIECALTPFDFIRLESEFFLHSHRLTLSRVRSALKRYVGLVFVRGIAWIQLLISYRGARRMLGNFNALSTQKLHCIFTGEYNFLIERICSLSIRFNELRVWPRLPDRINPYDDW